MSVLLSQIMQPDYAGQYNITPNADSTHWAMVKTCFAILEQNKTDSSLPARAGQRRAVPLPWDLVFTVLSWAAYVM